jgi:diguanylate cyclase (GGDEF)-like protein/PAS domain S-box-containing protein
MGRGGLVFPDLWKELENREEKLFFESLVKILELFNESYEFSESLSKGDLTSSVSRENVFAMPLKALQANLHHLIWQTNQVANGKLSQQVFFLGDFSSAFNNMIAALQEKRVIEERLQTITDTMGEGLFLVNVEGKFVFANPEALKMLDYEFEELEDKTIHETVFLQLPDGTRLLPNINPLWLAIENGETQNEKDAVFTGKSGLMVPVSYSCRPINHEGSLGGAVISFRDISVLKKYLHSLKAVNQLLEKQASTDALTGISNRLEFDKVLEMERKKAERYGFPLSLILFDIDHFKHVNDTYGHSAGDEVLKNLTRLIGDGLRETDLFARWGGEEFVILCPGNDFPTCLKFAERIRKTVEMFDFQEPKRVTASFGVSVFEKGDSSTKFINRADSALYRAKGNGRNRVEGEIDAGLKE